MIDHASYANGGQNCAEADSAGTGAIINEAKKEQKNPGSCLNVLRT